jgi:tight adherence protein C
MQMITVIVSMLLIGLGLVFAVVSLVSMIRGDLNPRLQTYVANQAQGPKQWSEVLALPTRELSGSLLSRILLPFFSRLGRFLGRLTPAGSIETLRHQLYIAGNPLGLGPREFYGIRVAFILVSIWPAYAIISRDPSRINILAGVSILLICFLFPIFWLRMMVSSRKETLRRGLPDTLDMLSVCADAGLGFDQSLQRVSEYWKTPISMELGRVVGEMEMGLSRREALRNFADRLDISEISSFVAVLLQSDQLGMSIAETLHVQAEQMRIERRFRAQEKANMIPIKMLIPLAFLIFPAILAVLLGPSIPPIMQLFNNF